MNCTLSSILHPKKLFSLSYAVYKFYRVSKHPKLVVSKFRRSCSNTGLLIAGCCCSKPSEDEPLLSNVNNDYNVPNTSKSPESLPRLLSQNVENSVNMKRKAKNIGKTDVQENFKDGVPEPDSKKTKLELNGPLNLNKNTETNCSADDSNVALGSQQCSKTEKPKKQRPNYFVAIKVSNDQIHKTLKEVQDHILAQDRNIEKCLIELNTLHITLMVLFINDAETHSKALRALQNVHSEHDKSMSQNPLELEFKGLGNFQNRVLFAKLSPDDSYERLCALAKSVKEHFAFASIHSTDTREQFIPHLTIAKIVHSKRQQRFIKKIHPSLYKEFNDCYFGTQKVEGIQLLSMIDPKTESGYYSGDEIFFSAFNPYNRISCLNKLLATEERKKSVRETINMLAKQKLN